MKNFKKTVSAVAAIMMLTMCASSYTEAPVRAAKTVSVWEAAPTWEGLCELTRSNMYKNINMDTYGPMAVTYEERNTDVESALISEAQNLKANSEKESVKYQLYDINRDSIPELIMTWPGKVYKKTGVSTLNVHIYTYDAEGLQVNLAGAVSNVTEIRKQPKKSQIVFITSGGLYKNSIITGCITKKGKLKKKTTYSMLNKNKYTKNKKKLSKKAYFKQLKSVKKLKLIKTKAIPDTDYYPMELAAYSYYSKDLCTYSSYGLTASTTLVMNTDVSATTDQDKYAAFSYVNTLKPTDFYEPESDLKRYVFGPNTKEDYTEMRDSVFGNDHVCELLTSGVDADGKEVLCIEANSSGQVSTQEGTSLNGEKSYKTMEYTFGFGDQVARMSFYTEGAYSGRIAYIGLYPSELTGILPNSLWTYSYGIGEGIPNEPEWDPVLNAQVMGTYTGDGAKPRTLEIGDNVTSGTGTSTRKITVNQNVAFELYSGGAGHFYTYMADGSEKWFLTGVEMDESTYEEIHNMLNPAVGDQIYAETTKFDKGIFWEPKVAAGNKSDAESDWPLTISCDPGYPLFGPEVGEIREEVVSGLREGNSITSFTVKNYSPKIVKIVSKKKNTSYGAMFKVKGLKKGKAHIKVTVKLKKAQDGKKKYVWNIKKYPVGYNE